MVQRLCHTPREENRDKVVKRFVLSSTLDTVIGYRPADYDPGTPISLKKKKKKAVLPTTAAAQWLHHNSGMGNQ